MTGLFIVVGTAHPELISDSYHLTPQGAHGAVVETAVLLGCEVPPIQAFIERMEEGGAWTLVGPLGSVTYVARSVGS